MPSAAEFQALSDELRQLGAVCIFRSKMNTYSGLK